MCNKTSKVCMIRSFIRHYSFIMESIASLSKEELVAKCESLLKENESLKNQLVQQKERLNSESNGLHSPKKSHPKKIPRPFDFSKYQINRVAFKFLYFGWDYSGFASQENTSNTIESELLDAFVKAKLIENRSTANYSRCGRTDKGVSAFSQVIALDVRSNFLKSEVDDASTRKKEELPYIKILNRILPQDIRVYAYAHVDSQFDARFSCSTRTYKYFFPNQNLNIESMKEAAMKLVGEHDFRNFCKVDVGNNVNHFTRRVTKFQINKISEGFGFELYEMEITGLAFLWHQVRCMAAVLILVGMGHEQPKIIDHLLDIDRCPKRPQYGLASEIPLVLFDCAFQNVEWIYEKDSNEFTINKLQQLWTTKYVQAGSISSMMDNLKSTFQQTSLRNISASVLPSYTNEKLYKKLQERAVCEGLDRHLEKQKAKRLKLEEKYSKNEIEDCSSEK